MQFLEKLSNFISKYMAVFVILVAAIALFQPWTFKWAAPNIAMLLGIVMFGMGTTLRLRDFRLVFQRPKDVFVGALAQFTIMPGLAWLLAKGFGLPPELAAGVILVGTCPGGTSSNVMTYLARGDVALSVSMTMTTTILAPVVTPLLTWWLAGAWVDISLSAMMMSIVKVVIVPIVGGILVNSLFGNVVQKYVKLLPLISVVAIVLIVGGVVAVSSQRIMETGGTDHARRHAPQPARLCARLWHRQGAPHGYRQGQGHLHRSRHAELRPRYFPRHDALWRSSSDSGCHLQRMAQHLGLARRELPLQPHDEGEGRRTGDGSLIITIYPPYYRKTHKFTEVKRNSYDAATATRAWELFFCGNTSCYNEKNVLERRKGRESR